LPDITPESLQSFYSGTETTPSVRMVQDVASAAAPTTSAPVSAPAAAAPAPASPSPAAAAPTPFVAGQGARIRFDPSSLSLSTGQTTTISVVADNVQDLFSIPVLLQYDPKIISIEQVSQGGFLSGGTQDIALVQRIDKDHGQAVVSATRMPNTPGVNGTGTLFGIQIRALAPGQTTLSIVQTNARDSLQHPIAIVTGETTINVK
jgi:general secretion pathway protein D